MEGDAYNIVYLANQGSFNVKIRQIMFLKNNVAYIITYSAETEKYDQYFSVIDKMFNSFQLTI